jgi:dTDP-D-glucose 4,6-dehydratase
LRATFKALTTGGAGSTGSAVVRRAVADGRQMTKVDALTYSRQRGFHSQRQSHRLTRHHPNMGLL